MNKPLTALLDLLFPPKCTFCHRLLRRDEAGYCDECARKLLHMDAQERKGEFFSVCVAALPYDEPVSGSIRRFKFYGRREYAAVYAPILAACIRERLDGRFDQICWVPISARRRRSRGYDQTEELTRETAKLLGLEPVAALRKVRHTPAQSTLKAQARRANVLGAFALRGGISLSGQRVLLIDDVVTTGATLAECSRVLLTAGAAEVVCAALAGAGTTKG